MVFWRENLVLVDLEKLFLVDCGRQKKWFWSTLTEKKLVLVDFGQKKWFWSILTGQDWFLTGKTAFSQFWTKKMVFDQRKQDLVDFGPSVPKPTSVVTGPDWA